MEGKVLLRRVVLPRAEIKSCHNFVVAGEEKELRVGFSRIDLIVLRLISLLSLLAE